MLALVTVLALVPVFLFAVILAPALCLKLILSRYWNAAAPDLASNEDMPPSFSSVTTAQFARLVA